MQMTWDWIAGFFEGEGNIRWQDHKPNGTTKAGRGCRILIGQNDKRPLGMIYEFLKIEGFVNPILYQRPPAPHRRVPNGLWVLALSRMEDTERFLRAISGKVPQKQEQLDRVLALQQEARRNTRTFDLAKAKELRDQGLSVKAIATAMHFGYHKTALAMRAAGYKFRSERTAEDWKRVAQLRQEGKSLKEIAEATGLSIGTIRGKRRLQALRRIGVPAL